MQFPVWILIPADATTILELVGRMMEPYDVARKVPPHKEYVPQEELDFAIEVFGLEPTDSEAVLAAVAEDSGLSGGIDAQGIYLVTTDNPDGHWDSWRIRDLHDDVHPVTELRSDQAPAAIVTPDGVWHGVDEGEMTLDDTRIARWKRAQTLLAQYPEHSAVTVYCHL